MNLSRFFIFGTSTARLCASQQKYAKICVNYQHARQKVKGQGQSISTLETKSLQKEESFIKKIMKRIPLLNVEKTRIMAAAYLLYEEVADRINYIDFFKELELPDTFYSWFVITELHIWMISVRVMAEGDDGRLLRNSLVEALWRDVNQRVKQLGASNPSIAREQVSELAEQLQAALIAYDEGLQSDDTVLASALWRRFYQQQDVDPECLDVLVKYIRKQIRFLDHQSMDQLLSSKEVNWEHLRK